MSARWPPSLPSDGSNAVRILDAHVPRCLLPETLDFPSDGDGLCRVDFGIASGRVTGVTPHGREPIESAGPAAAEAPVDFARCLVFPCFADVHTHLDKGHIWPRAPNADGTFGGALAAAAHDRTTRWDADDITARFDFGLRCAYAHGTAAMRTHLDSIAPFHRVSWPVFAALRERWRDRIALQGVTIVQLGLLHGPYAGELADLVAGHDGILGAVVPMSASVDAELDRIFGLASARGLDLDFHADETGDPEAKALRAIAEAKTRNGFAGRVVVGHCCSIAVQSDDEIERTLAAVERADVAIVSLPMCNLYLQDRVPARTPRWRGVTLIHELRARGIDVAIASDNCRDPFFGYGDHDMLEVFREGARIAHLDRPVGDWPAAVTDVPARIMGLHSRGRIVPGASADLVLFNARDYSELFSRPQSDRIVLRAGRPIDSTLPDYRELDARMGPAVR